MYGVIKNMRYKNLIVWFLSDLILVTKHIFYFLTENVNRHGRGITKSYGLKKYNFI